MGLLDAINGLGNLSDDQSMGLLAAGTHMLGNSFSTRAPSNVMQLIGEGAGVYKGTQAALRKQREEEEAAKQMAAMRGLQITGLTQEQGLRQQSLDMNNRIKARLKADTVPSLAASGAPVLQDTPASAMPGGDMSPKLGGPDWMQSYQKSQPSAPSAAPMSAPNAAPMPSMPSGGLGQTVSARLVREAQIRSDEGDFDGANKLYEQATKYMPQVDKIEVGTHQGKPVRIVSMKDGSEHISAYGVAPKIHFADDGQNTGIPLNEYTGEKMGAGLKRLATPGEVLQNNQSGARLAFDKSKEDGSDGAGPFTPGAILNAAGRYNLDGTLPPMGMGKSGSAGRAAILNKAAELNAMSPEEQRRAQLNAKGDIAARNASVRDYASGGKSGQAIQAANTALNHMETVERLALAQKNGDVRAFNLLANKLAAEFGGTAPTNLQAALAMVAPEVSKSVIGAAGGVEERAAFEKRFAGNGSPQQAIEGIGTIKELLGGRLTESQRTYERTTGNMDFRDKMLSPAAQRVLDKAHGAAVDPASSKAVTLSDIAATAKATGKSTAQITADLKAKGYTIGGM